MATALAQELEERIRSCGPVPFPVFMEQALYHPRHGYYATRVPGNGTAYRTSPSLSPWFGRLVARELRRMWAALGRPEPFGVVEVGGGLGDLAAEAIAAAGPMADALRWRFVERFDDIREQQRRRLGDRAAVAEWAPDLGTGPAVVGCVLGNEVLDNFPVHVVEAGPDGVYEVYVGVDGDRFVERLGPPSDPVLVEEGRRAAGAVGGPVRLEVAPGLGRWCRLAWRALARGFVLLADYGGVEPDVWREHPRGTLATYYPPDVGPSPLDEPGRKDITADVNFSALERALRSAGFRTFPLVAQREWLASLGLFEAAEEVELAGFEAALAGWIDDAVVLEAELHRLLDLAAPDGLGSILVLRALKS